VFAAKLLHPKCRGYFKTAVGANNDAEDGCPNGHAANRRRGEEEESDTEEDDTALAHTAQPRHSSNSKIDERQQDSPPADVVVDTSADGYIEEVSAKPASDGLSLLQRLRSSLRSKTAVTLSIPGQQKTAV